MPHLNIVVSKTVSAQTKNELQLEIGNIMEIIPGKTIANTVITIADGCSMYKNSGQIDGAFIDVRLFKSSPEESKKAFSEALFAIMEKVLKIPPESVQMNFIELPNWASGGNYR